MRKLEERNEAKGLETGFRGKEALLWLVITEEMSRRRGPEVESKKVKWWQEAELAGVFSFS